MKRHVKHYFVDWQEGALPPRLRQKVDAHLKKCTGCRVYFDKMAGLFTRPAQDEKPALEVDPFALTRIRAAIDEQKTKKRAASRGIRLVPAFIYSLILALALLGGFWMGKSLVTPAGSSDLYAVANQQSRLIQNADTGFDQVWENIVEETIDEN